MLSQLLCVLRLSVYPFLARRHISHYCRNLKQLMLLSREQIKFIMLSSYMLLYVKIHVTLFMLYYVKFYVKQGAIWCIHENKFFLNKHYDQGLIYSRFKKKNHLF